ncbi:islet cell autoantigen 1 [Tribolium castaneum]|uniref:Islet cell autoantigen 1-like Protein n=1 Tax=Tribolium castaneum TaxID=7070 RepID=D6WDP9_TRICA|nr:PREDICTED: islet cell autoantigen 1 [Tribolium castaneum]EEZ99938.1 Islet cell autoantigen 1-like Protein [Tribolium castaneum]|eukprot:XP_970302.1 PREDICTED: islet cell autoantigen 1 [Tribolium castaneum]
MQHQYWVTKKSVLRKLGGKEDECIVSSDAELDAKLELFKSINDSCVQLQRVIDLYQERLCYLAQEENALGRYLKEYGKNEKNASAGQIMSTAGKALAYTGHQRLTVRPPLVRLHHEVETFRGRAVSDTRATVIEMEKARTEYRAALSWMKSVSTQLDPDTGHGLDRFRKAQSYVKSTKTKFDRLTLACLQKVDLLAAARCNMFSHALVPYQGALATFAAKATETLTLAANKVGDVQPYDFSAISELATPQHEKDKDTFFNAEYTDKESEKKDEKGESQDLQVSNLLGEEFSSPAPEPEPPVQDGSNPSSALLDLCWPSNSDFLGGDFMPSKLIQEGNFDFSQLEMGKTDDNTKENDKPMKGPGKGNEKNGTQMSWLSLFAELDPLANADQELTNSGDRA